jgi:hypothetical protein
VARSALDATVEHGAARRTGGARRFESTTGSHAEYGRHMTETELENLIGHRFPGGTRTIEHWENWLLTDCTGREQLPDHLVHPVALFHVPIQGVGTSIAELFALGQVEGAGSVGLDGYDWEYFQPLREDVEYRFDGGVIETERVTGTDKRTGAPAVYDRFVFSVELTTPDGQPAARITNHWRLRR